MKKIVCMWTVLLICLSMAVPAAAESDTFVPSITYKDGPEIVEVIVNGEQADGCVVVSSIKEAKEKTTDIYQEDRDLLLEIYEKLEEGAMELPLEDGSYVVRELVDVSFVKTRCVEAGHGHKEWLAQEDTTITVKFDLDIRTGAEVTVLVYLDGEWTPAERVVNNGDGTVTCEFEDICPVAFCVDPQVDEELPQTGTAIRQDLLLWILLLGISCVALGFLLVNWEKLVK